jgi:hypothetical protein
MSHSRHTRHYQNVTPGPRYAPKTLPKCHTVGNLGVAKYQKKTVGSLNVIQTSHLALVLPRSRDTNVTPGLGVAKQTLHKCHPWP